MRSLEDFGLESVGEQPWRDREVLTVLYCEEVMSMRDIGNMLGCATNTVRYWLEEYEIETRGRGEGKWNEKLSDKEWTLRMLNEEGHTTTEIAEMADTASSTVCGWLRRHGVEAEVNHVEELRDEELLRELYHGEGLSSEKIGDQLGCDSTTVLRWLREHGISRRDPGPRDLRGENHPQWTGGYEGFYGSNWKENREKCIQRDGEECRICGMGREDHRERFNKDLHAHHIQPRRLFDDREAANEVKNLATVCELCHKDWEGIPVFPTT